MICSSCKRKIEDDEEFYIDDEYIYCSDCVEETTVTYYSIDGTQIGTDDNVSVYDNKEEAIDSYKDYIKYLKKKLKSIEKEMENTPNEWKYRIMINRTYYKNLIETQENLLKNLLDNN